MQLKVCESDDDGIIVVGTKEFEPVIYQASKWVREGIQKHNLLDFPNTTSGIKISQIGINKCAEGSIGYFVNDSNTPSTNGQLVGLFSLPIPSHWGKLPIFSNNIMRVCALFTARRTVTNTWINHYDEYSAPNAEHPDYQQWNNDACVYALFNSKSNQSSLRNVPYKGKIYQIKNEFFFVSKEEMQHMSDIRSYTELYHDVQHEPNERYVYTLLKSMQLSGDAKHILESAQNLIIETMPMREGYSREHPELQLDSWDAGYVQLKGLWKEHAKEKFERFRTDYLKFDKRMMKGVYKFGFLNPDFSTIDYV